MKDPETNSLVDAEFTRVKIVVRWSLPEHEFPTEDDQQAVEKLAERMDRILGQSTLAEVGGFQSGCGYIDILIHGKETDEDTDEIYSLIVDSFRGAGCPVGSCIIRRYREPETEAVSDIIYDR